MHNTETNELTVLEIKDICKSLLKSFDIFCQRFDIKYTLAYGSMLGAKRHNGFIPWDDDIDIIMVRAEYDKLLYLYKNNNTILGDNISLFSVETESKYTTPLPKIVCTDTILHQPMHAELMDLGVYIDIFVFDKICEDEGVRVTVWKKCDFFQKLWWLCEVKPNNNSSFKLKFIKAVLNMGFAHFVSCWMTSYAKRCNSRFEQSGFYSNLMYCGYGRETDLLSSKELIETERIKFEDMDVSCSIHADKILTQLYGEYMILPPIEDRITHHNFVAYWKTSNR